MKERPILFSDPMVRAILEGKKTQTRRIVKPGCSDCRKWGNKIEIHPETKRAGCWCEDGRFTEWACPYGQPGDELWVREAWGIGSRPCPNGGYDGIEYRADEAYLEGPELLPCHKIEFPEDFEPDSVRCGWKPSIHMFRWMSRIQLKVTDVRVERLQDISEEDAKAEGVNEIEPGKFEEYTHSIPSFCSTAKESFETLWLSINGPHSLSENPWVWAVTFEMKEAK